MKNLINAAAFNRGNTVALSHCKLSPHRSFSQGQLLPFALFLMVNSHPIALSLMVDSHPIAPSYGELSPHCSFSW